MRRGPQTCTPMVCIQDFLDHQNLCLNIIRRFHGREEIQENSRYVISLIEDQKLYFIARLEIINVKNTDKGEYRAIAKNLYGQGVATINLNFEGATKPKYET